MLSRTADHLFWMARYVERAENTARMLDVNMSTSLLPQSAQASERAWRGILSISELTDAFEHDNGSGGPDIERFDCADKRNRYGGGRFRGKLFTKTDTFAT